MLSLLRKVADGLIELSATIGSLGLVIEVIIILIDVIGRAFGYPLLGSQDLITMTMVFVVFGGMAVCDRFDGHISIDIFEDHYPAKMNRFIDILSAALGAIIFLGIAWTVYESSKLSLMLNLSTNLLFLPKAWFQWALSGFALLTALGMLLRAIEMAVSGLDVRKRSLAHE
ncbi:MAG: TRAP transporter small permease [Thiolinea sp.]